MKHDSGRLLIFEELSLPGTSVTDSCRVTAVSGATAKQEIIPGTTAEIKHISEPNWIWKKNRLLLDLEAKHGDVSVQSCERHPPLLHKDQNPPESRGDVPKDDRMSAM